MEYRIIRLAFDTLLWLGPAGAMVGLAAGTASIGGAAGSRAPADGSATADEPPNLTRNGSVGAQIQGKSRLPSRTNATISSVEKPRSRPWTSSGEPATVSG